MLGKRLHFDISPLPLHIFEYFKADYQEESPAYVIMNIEPIGMMQDVLRIRPQMSCPGVGSTAEWSNMIGLL